MNSLVATATRLVRIDRLMSGNTIARTIAAMAIASKNSIKVKPLSRWLRIVVSPVNHREIVEFL
ncbi:hypothetical protein [Lysobacter sp. ISL-52]|uniref:hypothetical protein n=1 Tax=Lysobacter sp. ISL-52 TaxID=2819154 RepID=UPI002035A7FC|nr:hypothetical protein [Lysobacter sp. ISL-52]